MTPDELIAQAIRALTGQPSPMVTMGTKLLGQDFSPMLQNENTPTASPSISQPPMADQSAFPMMKSPLAPSPPVPASSPGFMGLSGPDWMKLIGVVGAPLRVGDPYSIQHGGGIRPLAALGVGAELYDQRQALIKEHARRQAISSMIQRGNQAIMRAPDPETADNIRQQVTAQIGAVAYPEMGIVSAQHAQGLPGGTGGSGATFLHSILGGPTKDELDRRAKLRQEQGIAHNLQQATQTRSGAPNQPGQGPGMADLLAAAAGSPELLGALQNQGVQQQFLNENILKGPAERQVSEFQDRQRAIEQSVPDAIRGNMNYQLKNLPTGLELQGTEPSTDEAVKALRARGLTAEQAKAYMEKLPSAEEQAKAAINTGQATPGNRELLNLLHQQTVPSADNALTWRVMQQTATPHESAMWERIHPTVEEKAQAIAEAKLAAKEAKTLDPKTEMLVRGYEDELRTLYSQVGQSVPATGLNAYNPWAGPTTTTQADIDTKVKLMLSTAKTAEERSALREALRRVNAVNAVASPSAPASTTPVKAGKALENRPMSKTAVDFFNKYGGQ